MQYIRERLSLNLSQFSTTPNESSSQTADVPDTAPQPPARRGRDGGAHSSHTVVSPTMSNVSESSESHAANTPRRSKTLSSPPSTYVTPFQSPVSSEKWTTHNPNGLAQQLVVQIDKPPTPRAIYVIDHGQFGGYSQGYSTPVSGGYVNHSFTNDNGTPAANSTALNSQPQVIREQYWSWSCKCHRQLNSREKVLMLVIGFLLLVIGGLSAYLGLMSDDGNPLHGGLLTAGGLSQKTIE